MKSTDILEVRNRLSFRKYSKLHVWVDNTCIVAVISRGDSSMVERQARDLEVRV